MAELQYTFSKMKDNVLLVTLRGGLDASNSTELGALQDKETEDTAIRYIVWDVSGLRLIASAGLRVVMGGVKACMARKGKFYLVGANPGVQQVIRITNLEAFLEMRTSLDDLQNLGET